MNKISKKIVSLVTMAAFALTLVPAAAFAATDADVQTSAFHVVENGAVNDNVSVDINDSVTAEFTISTSAGAGNVATGALSDNAEDVKIWAIDNKTKQVTSALVVEKIENDTASPSVEKCKDNDNVYKATSEIKNGYKVKVSFLRDGEYTLYAGVGEFDAYNGVSTIEKLQGASVITVNAPEVAVKSISFEGADVNTTVDNNQVEFDQTANGINAENVKVKVVSEYVDEANTGTPSSQNVVVAVENPYSNIHVQQNGKDVEDGITLNSNGEATIAIIADYGIGSGTYTLKFTAGDVTEELKVNIPDKDAVAQTIQAVKMESNVVASDKVGTLENAVQFIVKDADGNEMDFGDLSEADTKNVKVTAAPEEFYKLDNAEEIITLAGAGEDKVITLATSEALPVGEYTVKVAIAKGANAEATFVVKKFDQKNIVELKLVATNTDVEKTSEVAMGAKGGDGSDSKYAIKPVWVDANGVTKVAEGVNIGLKAGTDSRVRYNANPAYYSLLVPTLIDDGSKNDNTSLIGAVVTIQAVDPVNGFNVSREFTVVDPANTTGVSLAFDSDNGSVEKNNKVEVTILDADGNKTEINDTTKVYAYVADKSNDDAYVQVTPSAYKNGKATLTVYADKATTADIIVSIVDDSRLAVNDSNTVANSVIYGGTLEYTFGEKDVNADKLVAMTIGSSDYIVDNDVVAGDAAPYIDSAWRTMVPVRVLAETLGGTVDYTDNVITIVDGDTTVVMTVGEDTYTVNDAEKTMDTAPVIGEGDRTFVPIRFLAEALGYTVTPLQDADGLTASVVFQK